MKLTNLKASSVRGIPRGWPDVPIGHRGLIIYGPNGVGKSSIIDALEFRLKQSSTLFPENRVGVSWPAAMPHVRTGQHEIAIHVEHNGAVHSISPENPPEKHPGEIQEWLATARGASFVLRRHMLLRFIDTTPKDRYDRLEPFLNLGPYQPIEFGLKAGVDDLYTKKTKATTDRDTLAHKLRIIFALETDAKLTETGLLERLNAKLASLNLKPCPNVVAVKARQSEIAAELAGKATTERLAILGALKNQLQKLGLPADQKPLVENLRAALYALEKETAARKDEILTDLLVRGKQIIEAAGLQTCPLCEQDIDNPAVVKRLNERINADARITQAKGLVHTRTKLLLDAAKPLAAATKTLIDDWKTAVPTPLPSAYQNTLTLLTDLTTLVESGAPTEAQLSEYPARFNAAVPSHDDLINVLDGLITAEGGGQRRNLLSDAAAMAQDLIEDLQDYRSLENKCSSLEKQRWVLERLHGHAIHSRKAAVQEILDDVSAIANELYERIHPGENISNSRLSVRTAVEGSVNLSTKFYGGDENPLLHYSESHLDTLGLCYFLATRKYEAAKDGRFKVLILDDFLYSIDADHRGRVAKLIKQEFADHQIIIATHDWYFYERLRVTLGQGGFQYLSITDWDIERGPITSDPSTDLDCILSEEQRQTRSRQDLAGAGGRFFEWILKQLTEGLEVAVRAKFEAKHGIADLWEPLAKKLRKHAGFRAAHPALIENINSNSWVRNACGAHHNEVASAVTPNEVREFAGYLAALFTATHCDGCGSFIAKQDNDDWRCDCGNVIFPKKG